MSGCLYLPSICCRRKPSRTQSATPETSSRPALADKDHEGTVFFDVISDYRDKRRITNEDMLSFYSFASDEDLQRVPTYSGDATTTTEATPTNISPLQATPASKAIPSREASRRVSPRGVMRCSRTGEFYGYRERINSDVDMKHHPDNYWWSNANLQTPTISRDMGTEPLVLSRVIKVTVVPSSFFASHRDMEVFPEYLTLCHESAGFGSCETLRPRINLIIFKLKMGDQVMVSLNEVINEKEFEKFAINQFTRDELLLERLKLIVSPINSPLPIPTKKPVDAETIGVYFGMDNVDFYFDESLSSSKTRVVSVLINIYSKWVIRKFLPYATASLGRICDFVLLSSDDKLVFADFRLLSTNASQALIRGKI